MCIIGRLFIGFTFQAKVTKVGFYTYNISSNNPDSHDVFVDAVEDVDPSKPITIGGGGSPVDKLYEIEVFTSSNNGKLSLFILKKKG